MDEIRYDGEYLPRQQVLARLLARGVPEGAALAFVHTSPTAAFARKLNAEDWEPYVIPPGRRNAGQSRLRHRRTQKVILVPEGWSQEAVAQPVLTDVQRLEEAVRTDPTDHATRLILADAMEDTGQHEKANQHREQAIVAAAPAWKFTDSLGTPASNARAQAACSLSPGRRGRILLSLLKDAYEHGTKESPDNLVSVASLYRKLTEAVPNLTKEEFAWTLLQARDTHNVAGVYTGSFGHRLELYHGSPRDLENEASRAYDPHGVTPKDAVGTPLSYMMWKPPHQYHHEADEGAVSGLDPHYVMGTAANLQTAIEDAVGHYRQHRATGEDSHYQLGNRSIDRLYQIASELPNDRAAPEVWSELSRNNASLMAFPDSDKLSTVATREDLARVANTIALAHDKKRQDEERPWYRKVFG